MKELNKKELKRGISVLLRVNIKLACDCRFPFYMLYRPEVEAEAKEIVIQKLRTFYSEFEKIKSVTFGSIGVINLARRAANRAAEVLPSNETVEKIISCCLQSINKVSTKKYFATPSLYTEVRRAAFCRLLFFNGRRPSEIANLTTEQWALSKQNYYLTPQQKSLLQSEGTALKVLEKNFSVIITIGKSKDVPVVIPKVMFKALDFLSNDYVRKASGVHEDNKYLFPSGMMSLNPASGQDNLRQFLNGAKVNVEYFSSIQVNTYDSPIQWGVILFSYPYIFRFE